MLLTYFDKIGDWNPQLFRELKGRLKTRNLSIAAVIAIGIQILLLLTYSGKLPIDPNVINAPDLQYSRYCTATPPPNAYAPYKQLYCIPDLLGNWVINWQLWWLDIFKSLSVIGLFILLAAGTYLLIADLSKEENRGTLNFIRLSPRSSNNIFLGKILGVPSIIYFLCLLLFPLHLLAGLQAHIAPGLILSYYGGILISCAFFFSLSLFFGLISSGLGGFQSFLGSGIILQFLIFTTSILLSGHDFIFHNPFDWMMLFYPGTLLSYLVKSTYIPVKTVDLDYETLNNFAWYGKQFWDNSWLGISFIFANYLLWTYWINQALNRRFRTPNTTWLSKINSYGISVSFIAITTGFVFQSGRHGRFEHHLFENLIILQIFIVIFACLLMVALSPQRQVLHDWARYRHQNPKHSRSLLQDLILGEKSPSTLAITLNLVILLAYIIPSIFLVPLHNPWEILLGLFITSNILIFYGIVGQRILLFKLPKPSLIATAVIALLMVIPPILFGLLELSPDDFSSPWFFTIFSLVVFENYSQTLTVTSVVAPLLIEWIMIVLGVFEMSKHLQKAGESQTHFLASSKEYSSTKIS
ncbi:MAG: hypothetical protein QNJ64_07220 [Crocosphaera sp.]|nr:hypothetical protein [Crocosphaera sp.]